VTIITLVMLQTKPDWGVSGSELASGLSFRLPPAAESLGSNPVGTALAAFGIIGVGAFELIMYPYWCLEKGYAKYTGPRDDSPEWTQRARGWMRVMQIDAWTSMVVYTFATVAFYLLGAAVLARAGLNPEKGDMIRTLSEMYVPVMGDWAPIVFLFGAFSVLYSTYFVAAAGNARMMADALGLFGLTDGSERSRLKWTRVFSAVWPLVAVAMFWIVGWFMKGQSPAAMVLACGVGQAIMLPMLGVAALYFRYKRTVAALRPGRLWDLMLWISFIGFVIAGSWAFYSAVIK
jgi:Mn2+/Fe2+ NRAMP family transporter